MTKADIREMRALIKLRFNIDDARAMTSRAEVPTGAAHRCPCCREKDTKVTRARFGRGFAPTRLACRVCGFNGDAIDYVMAARGLGSVAAAIDAVEGWLGAEK